MKNSAADKAESARTKVRSIVDTRRVSLGPSVEERMAQGKALRDRVPRTAHGKWKPPANRPDPVATLKASDRGRLQELLPIRYGRMIQSPFAFFRGAASVMAADLAETPKTGLRVQACGDCHLLNFGGYGSPERQLVFDINDFDETLPAPWEWDVKRLAASVVLAGRQIGARDRICSDGALATVASYRTHMRDYARMTALNTWYSHLDADVFIKEAKTADDKKFWRQVEKSAKLQTAEHIFPKMTEVVRGRRRIVDRPPLVYHPRNFSQIDDHVRAMFHRYRQTLPDERRVILDRYQIVDIARKIVGVGSVGTRCAVALLMAGENDALFLQFKEALPSVLEAYAGKNRYQNHGERVVTGQRMLQASSDVFLGWTRDDDGHDYYFRQLRDMKMSIDVGKLNLDELLEYVEVCGWALARAHARTGDAARIGGYLGRKDIFDEAVEKFATEYADQTERDHQELVKAVRAGKLRASINLAA
ncbi:MAG: DUF2252 domain-containing protein [Candidatus Acidiferrales bacterium]